MAELVKHNIQPIKIIAKCECGGEFEPTGVCLTSYHCQYPHICNKCGKAETFDCRYPKIEFEDVDTRTSLKVELSDGCKECLHSSLCREIENLKCRKEFVWYQAESGCPYYTGGVRVV